MLRALKDPVTHKGDYLILISVSPFQMKPLKLLLGFCAFIHLTSNLPVTYSHYTVGLNVNWDIYHP